MKILGLMGYELIEKIKNNEIKIQDLIINKFNRIEETEHILHSFVRLFKEKALVKAKQLDENHKKGKSIGKLYGLPIAIDDGICVKNCPTTCCSKILEGYKPPFSATVIEKLIEQENAINIGSTNMDEFAMGTSTETSCYGPTFNPWKLDHVPGGGNGGSGACIALNQSILSLGCDMGGSLRCPASYCGVVGLKPTFGRVSKFGLASYGNSLEQIGPITKCVHDCALLLEIMAGQDPLDPTTANKKVDKYTEELEKSIDKKIIGVPKELFEDNVNFLVKKSVSEAIDVLKNLGAKTINISFPYLEYSMPTYYLIVLSEEASNLAKFDGLRYGKMSANLNGNVFDVYSRTRGEKFGSEAKRRAMLGSYLLTGDFYDMFYIKALKIRTLIKNDFQNAFKQCDAIVTPTMPTTAFKIGELIDDPLKMYQMNSLTCPANITGLPALTLPCGFDNKGLPIGVQIIGNYFDEKGILNIGYLLEQKLNLFRKIPEI
jgi:aspartyl-tRNA(Asn)/glutamyl-tRNA(Gln) amidotransferase subunit A